MAKDRGAGGLSDQERRELEDLRRRLDEQSGGGFDQTVAMDDASASTAPAMPFSGANAAPPPEGSSHKPSLTDTVHMAPGPAKQAATPFEAEPEKEAGPPPEVAQALAMRDEITASANAAFADMQRMATEALAAAKGRFGGDGPDLESIAGRSRALAKLMTTEDAGLQEFAASHLADGAVVAAADLGALRDALRALGAALAKPDAAARERIQQVSKLIEGTS